ncbi:hypothetical protein [Sphingobacterium sp.]|uniref:hypothetical protein n=1 Tax=Sphingobacterium sp. TaxID=341027 RepID=UPI00289B549C|nr:hypothetical protein [Sphingobacterium sp.]
MKVLKLTVESLLVSMIFNLIGNDGIKLERFWKPIYWIWTLAFALAIIIAVLLIHLRLKVLWIYWQKRYPELKLLSGGRLNTGSLPKGELLWSILSTVIAILLVYLCFIYLLAFVRNGSTEIMFRSYLIHYMPFIGIGCLFYVSYVFIGGQLWWLTAQNTVALQEKTIEKVVKIVPPSTLDKVIVVGSLYDVLYSHAPFEPKTISKDAVRMFDVPFYFSKKREKEVILIDGTRLNANHFVHELERMGLDKWYFRINSTCRVNMMHIRYPVNPNTAQLEFRKEVFDSLRTNMTVMDIGNLLLLTEWMRKEKKLKDFLDNVHHLQHKGWDHLIRLK